MSAIKDECFNAGSPGRIVASVTCRRCSALIIGDTFRCITRDICAECAPGNQQKIIGSVTCLKCERLILGKTSKVRRQAFCGYDCYLASTRDGCQIDCEFCRETFTPKSRPNSPTKKQRFCSQRCSVMSDGVTVFGVHLSTSEFASLTGLTVQTIHTYKHKGRLPWSASPTS